MFRLASFDLSGRRVLIVEDEECVAAKMAEEIEQSGGVAIGPVADVAAALALIQQEARVDCAMLDVRQIADSSLPIISVFKRQSIEVIFVTGHDDWFFSHDM